MDDVIRYKELSLDDLGNLFKYDVHTGELRWKVKGTELGFGKFMCDDKVGTLHSCGHLVIKLRNLYYDVHRIIFFGYYGYVPKRIKHVNNNLLDNRIINLRDTNARQVTDVNLVREYLYYDPDNGLMRWIKCKSGIKVGDIAGCIDKSSGYMRVYFNGVKYYIHQLIWMYMTGNWSDREIDHINLDKTDNRWSNLREASPSENSCNKGMYKNNTTGIKGVTWNCTLKLWWGSISFNNVRYRESFHSKEEAAQWVNSMREQLHKEYARHE